MDVSENSGTPKSSILIGFSIIFTIHFGYLYFWKHLLVFSGHWTNINELIHFYAQSPPRLEYSWCPASWRQIFGQFLEDPNGETHQFLRKSLGFHTKYGENLLKICLGHLGWKLFRWWFLRLHAFAINVIYTAIASGISFPMHQPSAHLTKKDILIPTGSIGLVYVKFIDKYTSPIDTMA